jgi:cytochrome c biogenesis protein CcmG/thiol:disulfide interchange protein DsbE
VFRFVRPFVFAAVAAASSLAAAATPALAVPHAGDAAPAFRLPGARGGSVGLSSYRGKPLYVNFFASWCSPCNEEAGTVASLYRKYHAKGLQIVGIDEQEDAAKALGFAKKYGWPFAIGLDDGDAGKSYGAIALPVHVFIDKHGKVSAYRLGEMEPSEIEDAIKKLL